MYFSVCYYAHVQEIVSIPDILYVYEIHPGSLSMMLDPSQLIVGKMSRCAHEIYRWLLQFDDCGYLTENYPLLYLAVIRNEVNRGAELLQVLPYETVCREFTEHDDKAFFMEQTAHLLRYAGKMNLVKGHRYATLKILNRIALFRGGSYRMFLMRDKLLDSTRTIVRKLRRKSL